MVVYSAICNNGSFFSIYDNGNVQEDIYFRYRKKNNNK